MNRRNFISSLAAAVSSMVRPGIWVGVTGLARALYRRVDAVRSAGRITFKPDPCTAQDPCAVCRDNKKVPFGRLPNHYIRGDLVPFGFDRIITPRFIKDLDRGLTYDDLDIRPILGIPINDEVE